MKKAIVTLTFLLLLSIGATAQTIYLGSPARNRAITREQRAKMQRQRNLAPIQQPASFEEAREAEHHNDRLVYAPHDHPFGRSLTQYGVEWWQFGFSFPRDSDPTYSMQPDRYGFGQRGNVWFLTPGPELDNLNTLTITEGTALFISESVFNDNREKDPAYTIARARQDAADFFAQTEVEISVDGQKVKRINSYRFQSPAFSYFLPQNSFFIDTHPLGAGFVYPAVFDGILMMVKPLHAGNHVIKAIFTAPDFKSTDQWNVTVNKLIDPAAN